MSFREIHSQTNPRLILGGAQLGANYGYHGENLDSSARQRVSLETLQMADRLGISAVDTARSYPNSEAIIRVSEWPGEVHTKLAKNQDPMGSAEDSLRALGRDSLDVLYLFHESSDWIEKDPHSVLKTCDELRQLALSIGISVYSQEELHQVGFLDQVDVIQIPFNLCYPGDYADLGSWRSLGKQIFARSIFLQGVLLGIPTSAPNPELQDFVRSFHQVASDFSRTPEEMAFGWVSSTGLFDAVIFGAEGANQVCRAIELASVSLTEEEVEALDSIPRPDPQSADPRTW